MEYDHPSQRSANCPFVSVVVPHYNDLGGLKLCLGALRKQSYDPYRTEIIVADNGSACGLGPIEELCAGLARVVLVRDKGAGLARNAAVNAARGHILAFTDADCQPAPDWIANGVIGLENRDVIGGAIRIARVPDPSPVELFERVFAFDNERYVTRLGFSATANMFTRRRTFDSVGVFLAQVSEDVEWCHRARDRGFTIGFRAEAVVSHPARRTWSDIRRKWERTTSEMYMLFRQKGGSRTVWCLRSFAAFAKIVPQSVEALLSDRLDSLRERLAVLGVLLRLRSLRLFASLRLLATGV